MTVSSLYYYLIRFTIIYTELEEKKNNNRNGYRVNIFGLILLRKLQGKCDPLNVPIKLNFLLQTYIEVDD